ncbi:HNH endonuclease [Nonomuraea jabiensis]|uniref:5-methylcytosine-specific restriction endonuclease McrA n=1 Tax=Nonomuraea jabiensis TaxID=882448 RepID=A0A7W9G310_9ACTN|nr:HNH endonuclease signature motif containing protein [Nonomuraea jabiensis]MBB5776229.1 5-methylcytosine-specific restriction endonuclease McrA [Nonomuraea jabiensis]
MARKYGADRIGSMAWKELRLQILERDGWRCRNCQAPIRAGDGSAHVDHRIPRHRGGLSTPENLQALCRRCNLIKSRAEAAEVGLRKRREAGGGAADATPITEAGVPCEIHGARCSARGQHSREW